MVDNQPYRPSRFDSKSWVKPPVRSEEEERRRELLRELKEQEGWKLLEEGLRARLRQYERALATGRNLEEPTIRAIQVRHGLLSDILADITTFVLEALEN